MPTITKPAVQWQHESTKECTLFVHIFHNESLWKPITVLQIPKNINKNENRKNQRQTKYYLEKKNLNEK